jgi:hypothetical protein
VKIALCVASRGRPKQLSDTLAITMAGAELPTTFAAVALDDDDDTRHAVAAGPRSIVSIAPREDSLGAKYNRCHSLAPADLYVVMTDDVWIAKPGWDAELARTASLFADGIGAVFFGAMQVESALPAAYALSAKLIEKIGFFQTPDFPFWWHDTTTFELVTMMGRALYADIRLGRYPRDGGTRGARDIAWWAAFFDLNRSRRVEIARDVILDAEFQEQPYRKAQLLGAIPQLVTMFERMNAGLRDAAHVAGLEATIAFDAPADARYLRIKARAHSILQRLPVNRAA